ncbi:hypothetical protein C8A00DRAFT_38962 [Chaetomidium leptoderma]|uniref:Small secreted protein n=1 Tax=Chaetomidium leptoderma TaxID=669021 RepID=A0AAN6VDE4_9PEZI|nr:hypothetical protein C8A00DRAFT_38962 [Chaetomidium leptoderma]
MLALKSLSAILAFGVLSATAAPASSAIIARQDGAEIKVCSTPYYGGRCEILATPLAQCFDAPDNWVDDIRSIQNLDEQLQCTWYQYMDCSGDSFVGRQVLNVPNNHQLNGGIGSWLCE